MKPARKKYLVVLICLMVLVSGCGRVETQTSTSLPAASPTPPPTFTTAAPPQTTTLAPAATMPQDWQYRWLKGIPCSPPCWEGVTPGVTTKEEALKLLRQSPLIDPQTVTVAEIFSNADDGDLAWYWKVSKRDPISPFGDSGYLNYLLKDQIVRSIEVSKMPQIKLKDIIQVYGEPDYIGATDETIPEGKPLTFVARVVYLDKGFMLETTFTDKTTVIAPEMEFGKPIFFVPGQQGFIDVRRLAFQNLVKWQGPNTFESYCRMAPDNGIGPAIKCPRLH